MKPNPQPLQQLSLLLLLISLTACIARNKKPAETPAYPENQESTMQPIAPKQEDYNTRSYDMDPVEREEESIDGVYTYEGSDARCNVTIYGNQWSGSFTFVSGFGDEYDNGQSEFQSGSVRGRDIYDESGYVKIGYVQGNSLTTTVGGQYITLRKR